MSERTDCPKCGVWLTDTEQLLGVCITCDPLPTLPVEPDNPLALPVPLDALRVPTSDVPPGWSVKSRATRYPVLKLYEYSTGFTIRVDDDADAEFWLEIGASRSAFVDIVLGLIPHLKPMQREALITACLLNRE